jgi:serine/threonine protein kinase
VDVFSFGNNLYALLTGYWPFYDISDTQDVQSKIMQGELSFIDQRYRNRSYAETKLIDIMERCWVYDSSSRATIFEIVELLLEAVETNNNHH